jgi:hypothetical protein
MLNRLLHSSSYEPLLGNLLTRALT